MIAGINESKTLTKHISCKCKCKFDGRKCNSNQKRSNDNYRCEFKKRNICEKDYIWNPATCSCKNGKYLSSIIDDSVILCCEIIEAEAKSYDEETKTVTTNFNEKNAICKTKNFSISLTFLLIRIALLIVYSIYFCLIKNKAKQKHLLPYYVTNNIFFMTKLSAIYILTNRAIKYVYIIHTCIHKYTYTCICTFAHIYTHIYTHIGIRLDDTKAAPYCFFIKSKAKKLTKIH